MMTMSSSKTGWDYPYFDPTEIMTSVYQPAPIPEEEFLPRKKQIPDTHVIQFFLLSSMILRISSLEVASSIGISVILSLKKKKKFFLYILLVLSFNCSVFYKKKRKHHSAIAEQYIA